MQREKSEKICIKLLHVTYREQRPEYSTFMYFLIDAKTLNIYYFENNLKMDY